VFLIPKTTSETLFSRQKNTPKAMEIVKKTKKLKSKGAKKYENDTNLQYKGY
jgi:hypothetical protein